MKLQLLKLAAKLVGHLSLAVVATAGATKKAADKVAGRAVAYTGYLCYCVHYQNYRDCHKRWMRELDTYNALHSATQECLDARADAGRAFLVARDAMDAAKRSTS